MRVIERKQMKKILAFTFGLILGATVSALWVVKTRSPEKAPAPASESAVLSNELAATKSELAVTKAELERARSDNDKLAAAAQQAMQREHATLSVVEQPKPKKTGLAAMFGGDGTNKVSEAMSGMMKAAIEQQMDAKLAGMKTRLNLTPEQETAIRDIMAKQMEKGLAAAQKMFGGEMSKEEMEKMGKNSKSEEESIKELLTPEQKAAYSEYEQEEKLRMTRLVANSELMQMQAALQLDEAQQDKVFEVLTERTMSQFDRQKDNPAAAMDFRAQFDKKLELMKSVLTPDQFERYKKMQEQQLKMIEAFMPKD